MCENAAGKFSTYAEARQNSGGVRNAVKCSQIIDYWKIIRRISILTRCELINEFQDRHLGFLYYYITFSIYSTIHPNSAVAQIGNWKKYSNAAIKFNFFYPPNWSIKTTHDNITGTTEVILVNPNSTRSQISILHNPNEPTLSSKTGKPVVPSRALTNLEKEISVDYVFFNNKFPHRYSISNRQSASDVVDYEKSKESQAKCWSCLQK